MKHTTSNPRAPRLLGVSATAALAFAGVAAASATRRSAHIDRALAPRIAFRAGSRLRKFARKSSPVGKWYVLTPAGIALGALVAASGRGRGRAGAAIALSGIGAVFFSQLFDRMLPQPPVPSGHRNTPRRSVLPSGHAFTATAVFTTSAYVLAREEIIHPAVAVPLAVVFPMFSTWMKLGARKHWPSDAAGGVLGGLAVASACCSLYETGVD